METPYAPPLTDKQQDVLDAIAGYITEHGRSPRFVDLMDATGIRSRGHMAHFLMALEAKGCIRRDHAQARSIRLTGVGVPRPVCPHCGHETAT